MIARTTIGPGDKEGKKLERTKLRRLQRTGEIAVGPAFVNENPLEG
jgi:hypothetical protein